MKNFFTLLFLVPLIFLCVFFVSTQEASAGIIIKSPAYLGLNNGLAGYWTFDQSNIYGTSARDTSGNGNNGSIIGGALKDVGNLGQALDFDGVNDNVTISSTFGLGITNVTTSNWVYLDSTSQSGAFIKIGGNTTGYGIGVGATNFDTNGNDLMLLFEAVRWIDTNITIGTGWHHVAMVIDSSSKPAVYIDGRSVYSDSGTNPNTPSGSSSQIGGYTGSGAENRFGDYNLDDIRIYNRALSATEVARLYKIGLGSKTNKAAVVDLQSRGLVGHWTMDGPNISGTRAKDSSTQQNHGTITGAVVTPGQVGQALNFDGVNDIINAGTPSSLNITGAITISSWIYPRSFGGGTRGRIVDKNSDGATGYILFVEDTTANDSVTFAVNTATAGLICNASANSIVLNRWQHVVATISSGLSAKIYVNGAEVCSATFNSFAGSGANNFVIGGRTTDTTRQFDGNIDDVRVYNRAWSAAEIRNLYNQGQSKLNSSQQSAAQSIDRGLVGYWNFDGPNISGTRAKDSSGLQNHGTITGAVVTPGQVGQALNFDGVDDYVFMGPSTALNPSGSVVMSGWFKLRNSFNSTSTTSQIVMEKLASVNDNMVIALVGTDYTKVEVSDGSLVFKIESGAPQARYKWTNQTSWNANQWYHFAVVLDASNNANNKIYINGVDNTSSTDSDAGTTANMSFSAEVSIGGKDAEQLGVTGWFNGQIDDIRMHSRLLSGSEINKLYNMGR